MGLMGRLAHVLVSDGLRLREYADQQQEKKQTLPARRGSIFDSRGRLLAGSRRSPDVYVDPQLLFGSLQNDSTARESAALNEFAGQLAARLNMPAADVASRILARRDSRYVVIKHNADDDEAEAVLGLNHEAVGVSYNPQRIYPLGSSMAHVVGMVGRDGHGLEGMEREWETHLRGVDGVRQSRCTVSRGSIEWDPDEGRDPMDGGHVVLTLDAEIQRIVETQLHATVDKFHAESAVGLVMNVKTGDLLAMACEPTFDPNNYAASPLAARRNRAITDPVEPGSCFKPFVASGALAEGFVTLNESINCHNGMNSFRGRIVRDTHPLGWSNLKGIIVESSNIGMGTIGDRMPPKVIERIVRGFGFGERTGIECPGESTGIVKPTRQWSGYSPVSIAFGQEIAVTPIQLITAFSSIVSGGTLLKPRVVRGLLSPQGDVLKWNTDPMVVRRSVRPDVARIMSRDILPAVVEESSQGSLRPQHYTMLGKTGTAQVPRADRRGYEEGAYLSSFLGAGPVRDPEIAVIVMVRKPRREVGYFGRTVSGPAVRDILDQTLEYLGVPMDFPEGVPAKVVQRD